MKRKPTDPRSATQFDLEIAGRIRAIRVKKNVTQVALAEQIGVTFQQAQKYETGKNRVSAGRLQQIASVLETPVSRFFGE